MVADFRSLLIDFCGDLTDEIKEYLYNFTIHDKLCACNNETIWTAEIKIVNSIEEAFYRVDLLNHDISEKMRQMNQENKYQILSNNLSVYFSCIGQDFFAIYHEIESRKLYAFVNNHNCWFLTKLIFLSIIHQNINSPIILLHSAGAIINKNGTIFLGKSGAGKSTVAQFLKQSVQSKPNNEIRILSDETIMLYRVDKTIRVAGTPWSGRESIVKGESADADLKCIFCLKQDESDFCKEIYPRVNKLNQLVHQVYSQAKSNYTYNSSSRQLLLDIVKQIPMYELHFTYSDRFIDYVERTIDNNLC